MKFSIGNISSLANLLRELSVGLTKLTIGDNFETFTTIVTIPATSVLTIRNELDTIPSHRFIGRQNVEAAISDSTTDWTTDYVYLENHGASDVTITVTFFK